MSPTFEGRLHFEIERKSKDPFYKRSVTSMVTVLQYILPGGSSYSWVIEKSLTLITVVQNVSVSGLICVNSRSSRLWVQFHNLVADFSGQCLAPNIQAVSVMRSTDGIIATTQQPCKKLAACTLLKLVRIR